MHWSIPVLHIPFKLVICSHLSHKLNPPTLHAAEKASLHVHDVVLFYSYLGALDQPVNIYLHPTAQGIFLPTTPGSFLWGWSGRGGGGECGHHENCVR